MAQEPKFTPGPWSRNIKPASKYPVIFAGRNTHVAQVSSKGLADDAIEANCDLIAAAPDLYVALEAALSALLTADEGNLWTETGWANCEHFQTWMDGLAVLAKARGEKP